MGRKFVAALMAAVALVPGVGMAQERGGGRSWNSGAQSPGNGGGWQRGAPQGRGPQAAPRTGGERLGGERQWQRSVPQARGGERSPQAGTERTWQRSSAQVGAPAQPAQDGARTWQRSTGGVSSGWAQRREAARAEAGREFRRGPERDGASERPDRQPVMSSPAPREAYRADRARDGDAFRRDRTRDRGDLTRERRTDAQRSWARSGADWNDHARWNGRRPDWGNQGQWGQGGWNQGNWNQGRWYDRGNGRGWNPDWRRDSRYDWAGWRATNRNAFRLPRYYAPYGWNQGYRRFSAGIVLSSMLFAQNYWINDPWAYRLPAMDDGLQWVRYYNDALLVDVYSGEVVDVVHDLFW